MLHNLTSITEMEECGWISVLRWLVVFIGLTLVAKFFIPTSVKKMKRKEPRTEHKNEAQIPLSVNYHFTRKCNYECKFCFHQAKTSYHLPIEEAKRGITMLVDSGMKKINFSGRDIN